MSTKECQKRYRAKRRAMGNPVKSGKNITPRKRGRTPKPNYQDKFFVAVDSEGMNYGPPHTRDTMELSDDIDAGILAGDYQHVADAFARHPPHNSMYQLHRTFLWGAAAAEPYKNTNPVWLDTPSRRPLESVEILNWLCSLREVYGPRAIFTAFAFSYDATQALIDLPLKSMQEVQANARPARDDPDDSDGRNTYTIYRGYAIRYLKGKYLTVARILPGGTYRERGGKYVLNVKQRITIYDTWGFFQSSLIKMLQSTPGCVSAADMALIEKGKLDRRDFSQTPLHEIRAYTEAELRALNGAMNRLRASLFDMGLKLTRWNGAGAIAAAAMTVHKVRTHYPDNIVCLESQLSPAQQFAHHAYFGGRIELMKYGTHYGPIHSYDIASAYPAAQLHLPSMAGGKWTPVSAPASDMCELSMFEVSWYMTEPGFPFGPFPYRLPTGAVYYPEYGRGIYCVAEIFAAMRAGRNGMPVHLTLHSGWEFIPTSIAKPFAYFAGYYRERAELVTAHRAGAPYDMREKVLKLALNASYGKCAQRVGGSYGKPPATANPWYAAAITSRTRARMLDAAMTDPEAIIMIATDGIYSIHPLPLPLSSEKELGAWEKARTYEWAQFVQSGVYLFEGDRSMRTRGIRIDGFGGVSLSNALAAAWGAREKEIAYEYTQYITLGNACRSESWRSVAGHWASGERKLTIVGAGGKRRRIGRRYCHPEKQLVSTLPAVIESLTLSVPRLPGWVSPDEGAERAAQEENAQIMEAKGF